MSDFKKKLEEKLGKSESGEKPKPEVDKIEWFDSVDADAWLAEDDPPVENIVENLIDQGDRVAIVGQSKARKSFYTLQLCMCVAAGENFLGHRCNRKKVLLYNHEVRGNNYRRRLRAMKTALNIGSFGGNLIIVNTCDKIAPELPFDIVLAKAKKDAADVVVLDPFYLMVGDENDQAGVKAAIIATKMFERHGITLINVFHSTKGHIGDKQVIDRIAGSGVFARDPTTIISLAASANEADGVVMSTSTRNYAPEEPKALSFDFGAFAVSDKPPEEINSRNASTKKKPTVKDLLASMGFREYSGRALEAHFELQGCSQLYAKKIKSQMFDEGLIELVVNGKFHLYKAKALD